MSVSNGQPVNQDITNAAFVSRTANTSASGIITLNNSGLEEIVNLQLSVLRAGRIERALQTISTLDVIEFLPNYGSQLIPLQSGGGEEIRSELVSGGDAFGSQEVTLIGRSDTNYLKLTSEDALNGLLLNGDCELKLHVTLTLVYFENINRWVEKCRNI
jgi:hypothetical protein